MTTAVEHTYEEQMSSYYKMRETRPAFDKRFEEHELKYEEQDSEMSGKIYRLRWAKPGTVIDSSTFVIERGRLFVYGDFGEAVYNWYSDINPAFLLDCHEHYIHGKCTASVKGRRFVTWNDRKLSSFLQEQKEERVEEAVEAGCYTRIDHRDWWDIRDNPEKNKPEEFHMGEDESEEEFTQRVKKLVDEDFEDIPECSDEYEWVEFLRRDGHIYFGDDWWEFAGDAGEVVDPHFICQMECLKRALIKLEEQKNG